MDNLIPKMTSNTTPSGIASATSIYNSNNTCWITAIGENPVLNTQFKIRMLKKN